MNTVREGGGPDLVATESESQLAVQFTFHGLPKGLPCLVSLQTQDYRLLRTTDTEMTDQELPPWLDEALLTSALQGGEDKTPSVKVLNFSGSPAVAFGNNFGSHLYRVRVDYRVDAQAEKQTVSLIVKRPITQGNEKKEKSNTSATEPRMYADLLPKLCEKVNRDFGPRQFYCSLEDGLIFNDLNEEGFVMCDKFKQLDFSHCEFALKTLAQFHAASVAYHKDDPKLVEDLGRELFYAEGGRFKEMMPWVNGSLNIIMSILDDTSGNQDSIEFLKSRANTLAEPVMEICKPRKKSLNVLNHGDLWINNMMFKYDDSGKVIDIKLIDFQVLRYTTPVIDLMYFIWTSADADVRESRLQELLGIYLGTLNDTLERLGLEERLSAEQFQADQRAGVEFVIMTCCSGLPYIIAEPQDVILMEAVKSKEIHADTLPEAFQKGFRGKYFRALLPNLMIHIRSWVSYLEKCQ